MNIKKKTAKQVTKSSANVLITTAGIAYCGAIGMLLIGPVGSLIGMGVGAYFGNALSKKAQNLIS